MDMPNPIRSELDEEEGTRSTQYREWAVSQHARFVLIK